MRLARSGGAQQRQPAVRLRGPGFDDGAHQAQVGVDPRIGAEPVEREPPQRFQRHAAHFAVGRSCLIATSAVRLDADHALAPVEQPAQFERVARGRTERERRARSVLATCRQQLPDLLPRPRGRIGAVQVVDDQERGLAQVLEQCGVCDAVIPRVGPPQPIEQVGRDEVERIPPRVEPAVRHFRQEPHPRLVGLAGHDQPMFRALLVGECAGLRESRQPLPVAGRDPAAVQGAQVAQSADPRPLGRGSPRGLATALDRAPEFGMINGPLGPHVARAAATKAIAPLARYSGFGNATGSLCRGRGVRCQRRCQSLHSSCSIRLQHRSSRGLQRRGIQSLQAIHAGLRLISEPYQNLDADSALPVSAEPNARMQHRNRRPPPPLRRDLRAASAPKSPARSSRSARWPQQLPETHQPTTRGGNWPAPRRDRPRSRAEPPRSHPRTTDISLRRAAGRQLRLIPPRPSARLRAQSLVVPPRS